MVMGSELEATAKKIKDISIAITHNHLIDSYGKLDLTNLEQTIDEIHQEITKESCSALGVNWDYIKDSFDLDGFEGKYLTASINKLIFGINHGSLAPSLREGVSNAKSADDLKNISGSVIKESQENLSNAYQEHILGDIKDSDYQEMAELYMPQNFERKYDVVNKEAFQLWYKTFKEGIITSDHMDTLKSYQKKEDYVGRERTKEEIAETFNFNVGDISEDVVPQQRGEGREISEEDINKFRQAVRSGRIPVLREGEDEYLINQQNGQRIPFDPSQFGLGAGDYQALNREEYQSQMRNNQIRHHENQANDLRMQENQANGNNVTDLNAQRANRDNNLNAPSPARDYRNLDQAV